MQTTSNPDTTKGALIAGAVMGVLTGTPIAGCCCILWGLGGGALAAYLAARTTNSYSAGQGAVAGVLAGGIGAVVATILSTAVNLVIGDLGQTEMPADVPPELAEILQSMQQPGSPVAILMGLVITGVILASMSAAGGAIAGSMIGKKLNEHQA